MNDPSLKSGSFPDFLFQFLTSGFKFKIFKIVQGDVMLLTR